VISRSWPRARSPDFGGWTSAGSWLLGTGALADADTEASVVACALPAGGGGDGLGETLEEIDEAMATGPHADVER